MKTLNTKRNKYRTKLIRKLRHNIGEQKKDRFKNTKGTKNLENIYII